MCCVLVTVDYESNQVRLVHVLQRLLKPDFPRPYELLATTCMVRLVSCGFQNSNLNNDDDLEKAFKGNTLLEYSYDAWVPHLRKCDSKSMVWDLASQFILACQSFPSKSDYWSYHLERLEEMHPIAQYDLYEILDLTPLQSEDSIHRWLEHSINAGSSLGRIALIIASRLGHGSLKQRLLEIPGIQVNLADENGNTALLWAAQQNNKEIVGQLLEVPPIEVNRG